MSASLALTAENGPFRFQSSDRPKRARELVTAGQGSFEAGAGSGPGRGLDTGRIKINLPLRILGLRNFPEVLIILQNSGQNLARFLLFSKKFRLRRAFIILFFPEGPI